MLFPYGISLSKQNRRVLTNYLNPFHAPIVDISKDLNRNKKGQSVKNNQLSYQVTSSGLQILRRSAVKQQSCNQFLIP
jgi:hypothetical protein